MNFLIIDARKGNVLDPSWVDDINNCHFLFLIQADGLVQVVPSTGMGPAHVEAKFHEAKSEPATSLSKAQQERADFERDHRQPTRTDPQATVERSTSVFRQ